MSIINPTIPDVVPDNELAITDEHRLLVSEQRRRVFTLLEEKGTPIELEDLASKVAMRGNPSIEDAQISLHHVHLPMMSEMNVIDYDPDTRIVRKPT